MKMSRRPIIIFLVLFISMTMLGLALFSFLGVSTQATSLSIQSGSYSDATVYLPVGGLITYHATVTSGDTVDVYLMPDGQVGGLINQQSFDYIRSASFNNTMNAQGNAWVGAGWYHLIVVPHNFGSSNISLTTQGGPTIGQLAIIPIISLIISAVVVLFIKRRRKRTAPINVPQIVDEVPPQASSERDDQNK